MGRYIECKIGDEYKIVWKYGFGTQASEMHRINTELGIGEYHLIRYEDDDESESLKYVYTTEHNDCDGDLLILNKSDLDLLEKNIKLLKESDKTASDEWYIAMLEAIVDFIREHSTQTQFMLEGEF